MKRKGLEGETIVDVVVVVTSAEDMSLPMVVIVVTVMTVVTVVLVIVVVETVMVPTLCATFSLAMFTAGTVARSASSELCQRCQMYFVDV